MLLNQGFGLHKPGMNVVSSCESVFDRDCRKNAHLDRRFMSAGACVALIWIFTFNGVAKTP